MNGLHGKCGQADSDVLGAIFVRSGVLDPFARMGDNSLARFHLQRTRFVLDAQGALQHDRELVEDRSLAGLDPTRWATHMRDAGGSCFRVNTSDVFVDELWFVARSLNSSGLGNESRHEVSVAA